MADNDLVRVRVGRIETNMGRVHAEQAEVEILDEPVRGRDGRLRADTARDGRPVKPKTTVAKKAAEKKAVTSAEDNKE